MQETGIYISINEIVLKRVQWSRLLEIFSKLEAVKIYNGKKDYFTSHRKKSKFSNRSKFLEYQSTSVHNSILTQWMMTFHLNVTFK